MSFEDIGKKIDNLINDVYKDGKVVLSKVVEFKDGVQESMKTFHRKGFEKAIELAANEARRGDHDHDPSERIAAAIRNIPYEHPWNSSE